LRVLVLRAGLAALLRDAELAGLARAAAGFFAALERVLVERDFGAAGVARELVDLRAPPDLLAEPDRPDDDAEASLPLSAHLPDMTRCAASATASAINEPSLATLLAAWVAVSAASRPASRIALRALGLALIAAAAAARPAASISLLIAALAILSTVLLLLEPPERDDERDDDDLEELFFADLAIACFSLLRRKRHFRTVTVPNFARKCKPFAWP
jgi:hypothetical protein